MNRRNRRNRGFSLMELMVVLVIMGILATVVVQNVLQNIDKAKVTKTMSQIAIFKNSIIQYKIDTNVYPDYLSDLVTMPADIKGWNGPYIDTVPLDGWGNEYTYYPPEQGSNTFEIISYGADGEEGGDQKDADISNLSMIEDQSAEAQ